MIASENSLKKHPCAKFVVQYITCITRDGMAWLESEALGGHRPRRCTVTYNLLNLSPTVPQLDHFPKLQYLSVSKHIIRTSMTYIYKQEAAK